MQLAWSVFGANLVVTAATGLTSNGRCPCVPLTWWTTIRKTFSTRWSTTVWTWSYGVVGEKPLDKLGCCLSAETHARMVFAMEAREGPPTQDRAEDVVVVSRLLFEGTIATCHQGTF